MYIFELFGKQISFRDITLGEYTQLLKTNLTNNYNLFFKEAWKVVNQTNMDGKEYLENTDILTFFGILIQLRSKWIGNEFKIEKTKEIEGEYIPVKFTQNVDHYVDQIIPYAHNQKPGKIEDNNITYHYHLPRAKECIERGISNLGLNDFIISIEHEKDIYPLDQYPPDKRNIFLENIPATILKDIRDYYLEFLKFTNSFILFEDTPERFKKDVTSEVDILSLILLLYRDNLVSLYETIYHLVKKIGFSAEYINSIALKEKNVYWDILMNEMKEEAKSRKSGQKNMASEEAILNEFL